MSEYKDWTFAQVRRANTVIQNLIYGAPTYQMSSLPSLDDRNCPSAVKYGKDVTDCVATWVKIRICCLSFRIPTVETLDATR